VSDVYRIYGAEVSPYSIKVRSYFRYKSIPHQWIVRDANTQAEYQKYAKLPLIPLVVTPDDQGIQDSTPIIERMEAKFPEPSIHPDDVALAFLSTLFEEFGDEWGNKWMFHYRWAREADQNSAAQRIARTMLPDADDAQIGSVAETVRERMVNRVWFVGSNGQTAPQIEDSFKDAMGLLEKHLRTRPYLFGARPSFGDFGMWGQVYNAWTDPTPGEILRSKSPHVVAWVERMLNPKSEGGFAAWQELAPTLLPLLERQVGRLFLPWSDANAKAIATGQEELTVPLDGNAWTQKPQKYHAKSLAELRHKYAAVRDNAQLNEILRSTGCLTWLNGS
jgi:glutathione S-transferase